MALELAALALDKAQVESTKGRRPNVSVRGRWKGFAELPAEVERLLPGLREIFEGAGVRLGYVFGSLTRSEPPHDVDLALLAGGIPIFELRQPIEQYLGTQRLDLVDLAAAPPLLRFEIVRTGRSIFVADERILNDFELATIHLYRDTQPLRMRQARTLRERVAE